MATVQEIKAAAKRIKESVRYGCFVLTPPVALRCKKAIDKEGGEFGKISKVGDIVHADSVDEKGRYPNTVHLKEKGFWWPIELFEVDLFE
jgi:hypothetical protein